MNWLETIGMAHVIFYACVGIYRIYYEGIYKPSKMKIEFRNLFNRCER